MYVLSNYGMLGLFQNKLHIAQDKLRFDHFIAFEWHSSRLSTIDFINHHWTRPRQKRVRHQHF